MSLHPAFSMSVDKSFADIQRFDFGGTAELRAWLSALSAQATAKADGCDTLCAGAKRAVTLVTCSANFAGAERGPHGIRRLIFPTNMSHHGKEAQKRE